MDIKTAEILCKINNDFYRNQSASFARTRTHPWPGWEACLDILKGVHSQPCTKFSIFDLACGNLRFEVFLGAALPDAAITFYAVDNCDDMVPSMLNVDYQNLDVMGVLHAGSCINDHLTAPVCDCSVSFGFLHHVPLQRHRGDVLSCLVRQTRSGGYVVVSLWQFLNNEDMARKAQAVHERAMEELGLHDLDEHDFLLGWKNLPGRYRYCHSFSEEDIDRLAESVAGSAEVVSRFVSDGRTNDLNTYLILKVL